MNKLMKHIYKIGVVLALIFGVAAFYFMPNNLENRFGMPFWVYDIVASRIFFLITMFLSVIVSLLAVIKSYAEKRWIIFIFFILLFIISIIASVGCLYLWMLEISGYWNGIG